MLSAVRAGSRLARAVGSSSSSKHFELSGLFPPLPTPFNQDESIAYDKLESNLRYWNNMPFTGYVIHGSNGEYPFLTPEERVEMVRKVRAATPKDKVIIAGSSCESTALTIKMSNLIAEAGAAAVMLLPPSYFKSSMTEAAWIEYFTTVADSIPIPVVLYNMPANVGMDMSAAVVTTLAQHPNIIGIKDSGGDITKMATVVRDTKHLDFNVLAGSAGFLLPSLLVGCTGGVPGMANIAGNDVFQIYKLFKDSKLLEAVEVHQRVIFANTVVTRMLGVPAMKAALDIIGLYGGPCRKPLQPLTPEQLKKVQDALKSAGCERLQ